jgi:hypothetical protein
MIQISGDLDVRSAFINNELQFTSLLRITLKLGEIDPQFPLEAHFKADEIFGDGKFAPGHARE